MMFILIYDRSKGLNVITVSMMCHWAIKRGGLHWHNFLRVLVDRGNNMSVYRMTELSIQKLERFPNLIEFIWSIHMIANDKIGQTPSEFDNVIDNIFKVVCCINVHRRKKSLLATYNPTQLQPIRVHPFLVSPCVIPCYKIIPIKNSVRAQDDNFSGFNIFLETVIKNLLRIHSWLMNLNGSTKASHWDICGTTLELNQKFLDYML